MGNRTDQRHKHWCPCNQQRSIGQKQRLPNMVNVDLEATVEGTDEGVTSVVDLAQGLVAPPMPEE